MQANFIVLKATKKPLKPTSKFEFDAVLMLYLKVIWSCFMVSLCKKKTGVVIFIVFMVLYKMDMDLGNPVYVKWISY